MPRTARKISCTNIYHIMIRGINRQQIFEDENDCQKFLSILFKCKQISKFNLFAYALMGNHVHLLLEAAGEPIDLVMKRINGRYAYCYNKRYERTGHLFQDRYRSEPVENELYFITVLRYIHQNPVKAGFCRHPNEYAWSSYKDYFYRKKSLTDTGKAFVIVNNHQLLINYLNTPVDSECMDFSDNQFVNLPDNHAKIIIKEVSNCRNVTEFQCLSKKLRNECIKEMKKRGLSIRQISRLCGISRVTISKILAT